MHRKDAQMQMWGITLGATQPRAGNDKRSYHIAHCRNVRALRRVSYIDKIENLNIPTEILMNEKLHDEV